MSKLKSKRTYLSSQIRKSIFERDNYKCQKCGRFDGLCIHHIIPRFDGGMDDIENLILLCQGCHEEWHSLEIRSKFSFNMWIKTPPLPILMYSWHFIDKQDARKVSFEKWREIVNFVHDFYKEHFF